MKHVKAIVILSAGIWVAGYASNGILTAALPANTPPWAVTAVDSVVLGAGAYVASHLF